MVFDHHAGELPDWVKPENAVVSQDGALTTTLVGVLAEREIAVTPLEATAFALGIHEDTGSLTYPTATQRDADALAWCLRHGARQDLLARFLHTPLTDEERELLARADGGRRDRARGRRGRARRRRHLAAPRRRRLEPRAQDRRPDRLPLARPARRDGRACLRVTRSRTPEIDAAAVAASLGGGGHREAASAIFRGSLDEAEERCARACRPRCASRCAPSRSCRGRRGRWARTRPSPHAMVVCQRYAPERNPRRRGRPARRRRRAARISTRRSPTASRTRRSRES